MKKAFAVTVGALLAVVGGLWTFQGLGFIGGSPMTGVAVWAVVGPLLAGFGVALMVVGARGAR
ncbi:MAG: hypothetical protein M3165_04195 [Actinomycetota bacterium]|nr:hypothetical protein [Actinomycetota bacterium]